MPSLYAKYIKEREDYETLELEHSFCTYKIRGDEVYIRDIYVDPDFRNLDLGIDMAEEVVKIARSQGCKILLGSVSPSVKDSHHSMKALLHYRMTLHRSHENMIYFIKDI